MTSQDLGMPRRATWAEDAVREAEAETLRPGEGHRSRQQQVLDRIDRARARKPRVKEPRITLAHGAGGKATHNLIDAVFLEAFRNPELERLSDAAALTVGGATGAGATVTALVRRAIRSRPSPATPNEAIETKEEIHAVEPCCDDRA